MTQNVISDGEGARQSKQGRGCEVQSQGLRRGRLMDRVRHETCNSIVWS